MITPRWFTGPRPLSVLVSAFAVLAATACEKVPLVAPSGSTITLTASTNVLPSTGSTDIVAHVLEPAGTPPHSGTHVIFTTTLGVIEPSEATTDINGRVVVRFFANGANGTATISAASGGANTGANGAVKIALGTAAVGRVVVNATPAAVASGGTATISATVIDVNGSNLAGTPVSFSTTAGTLSSGIATTGSTGVATTSLTTSQTATVTASVGATPPPSGGTGSTPTGQTSGTVTVTVIPPTTVTIAPPSAPPSAGLPATFTFTVTIPTGGNPNRELRVTWGDGASQNLGAVTGAQSAAHVYNNPGTYAVTATAIDVAGVPTTTSTSVTVIPVPRPTVIVTATPQTQTVGGTINFSIQITVPAGIGVQRTQIDFGDGEVRQLGGATSATVQKQYKLPGQYTVTVSVLDTTGQTTEGTTTVSITAVPPPP